jgi:uncharacterized protein YbjT (DUF2867 family)
MTIERVFIIGGTGSIGKQVVKDLVAKNASVTLFARSPDKVSTLFPATDAIHVVKGDLQDISNLKESIRGHSRLFLILEPFQYTSIKGTIAQYAYEAGVQQIVDISTLLAGNNWRTSYLGSLSRKGENDVLAIPNRGTYVALRPGRFFSNVFGMERVSPDGFISGPQGANDLQGWISPNDIGSIAANILTEDIKKHGDAVYELIGEGLTSGERAQILTRVLGREVQYIQTTALERYNLLMKFNLPHLFAYEISSVRVTMVDEGKVSTAIPIILGRQAETFEEYIEGVKHFL